MITKQEKIINKFRDMSLKYHKLSMLFNELAGSLTIKYKELGEGKVKDFMNYIKELNINLDLLKDLAKQDVKCLGKRGKTE